MNIIFQTKNIDSKFYEKCILRYIYDHFDTKKENWPLFIQLDQWKIIIKSLDDFDFSFYDNYRRDELSSNMAHGVTGINEIVCYIHDIKNDFYTLQNLTVIAHELGHMILKIIYPDRITEQRHDDFYGKAGYNRKFFSSEIHDRLIEGKTRKIELKLSPFKKYFFYGVDILDLAV